MMNQKRTTYQGNSYQELTSFLERHDWFLTKQRKRILAALVEQKEIDNIEDFWLKLRQEQPISWATVYSTVSQLVRYGIVRRSAKGDRNYSYQLVV